MKKIVCISGALLLAASACLPHQPVFSFVQINRTMKLTCLEPMLKL